MKIVMITSSFPRFEGDSAAPFIKSIYEALTAQGNDVHVVAPYDPLTKLDTKKDSKIHRFKYIFIDKWHIMGHARSLISDTKLRLGTFFLLPLFLISATIKLNKIVQSEKPELIYVHWVVPNGIPALIISKIFKIPYAISLHGSDIFVSKKNFVFRFIAKSIFANCSLVTACSPELYSDAVQLGSPKNIHLLPWGADPKIFFKSKNQQEIRQKYQVETDDIVLISLGRMVYKKGFTNLILALPAIIKNHPNVKIIIGGDGKIKQDLIQLANNLGVKKYVILPGNIPWNNVREFLSLGNIFLLPSIKDHSGNIDGLPTVVLEAMACSLPIIASDIGGISLVVENEKNGFLIKPDDPTAISQAVIKILDNPELINNMGKVSRLMIETIYNWNIVAEKLTAEFKKIVL